MFVDLPDCRLLSSAAVVPKQQLCDDVMVMLNGHSHQSSATVAR